MNVQLQSSTGNVEVWRIDEPVVSASVTPIPEIHLDAGDEINVTAGGCVQTGGAGKTWKRYLNPSGPNSDRLYHGTIWLPGMGTFIRIQDMGPQYVVPSGTSGTLRIGYEDDHYGDNGYWGHDDGTEDQCRGVGNAWLVVTIARNASSSNVRIAAVEQTQSTQFFDFNGGGSGAAPDNSIPMVSGKPTIIRVYADVSRGGPPAIDGTLTIVEGSAAGLVLSSLTGAITGRSVGDIDRANFADTLNFLIPAAASNGQLGYEVAVFDGADTAKRSLASGLFRLDFIAVPPLAVHSVLIHYTGVDYFDQPVDDQTSGLDVLTALDYVLRTYPVSTVDFDGCEVLPWSKKLAVAENFLDLFGTVASMRALSASNDLYIALIPPSANCGGICGYGAGGAALFFTQTLGDSNEASHEIGHAIGRAHAPGCLPMGQAGDTQYPQYNGYPRASIGEVGVDTRTLATFDPETHDDYMSYCSTPQRWTSPYGYLFALDALGSGQFSGLGDALHESASGASAQREYGVHYVLLKLHRAGATPIEVVTAFDVPRMPPHRPLGRGYPITLEIYDEDDAWLFSTPLHTDGPIDPDQPLRLCFGNFPDYKEFHHLRVSRRGEVLATMKRADDPPKLDKFQAQSIDGGSAGILRLHWKGSAPKEASPPLRFAIRYTTDGKRWRPIAVNLTTDSFDVDLARLPGGKSGRFQLLASAGFRTTMRDLSVAERPLKPREVLLLSPTEGAEFTAGSPIACVGCAFSVDHQLSTSDELVWTSLSAGALGIGSQLTLTSLPVGLHTLTLHADDGRGGTASRSVRIKVTPRAIGRSTEARHRPKTVRRPPPKRPCGCGG